MIGTQEMLYEQRIIPNAIWLWRDAGITSHRLVSRMTRVWSGQWELLPRNSILERNERHERKRGGPSKWMISNSMELASSA